jgi:tetratricopeptide (TPR) repeat protein
MRDFTLKSALMLLIISFISVYIGGCSSAEQTTGRIAYAQGDFEKAEKEFELETKQNPANEEAWFYLAMSRIQLNKVDQAEVAIKEYRKIGKKTFDDELVKMWGTKYDQGYNAVEKAKQSASDTALQFKLYREAINDFKAAFILQPDSVFVQKNIEVINNRIATIKVKPLIDKGADLIKDNKYDEAISYFKQAENVGLEKDNPAYDIINYNMGLAYLKWGEEIREKNKDTNPDDKSYLEKYKEALPYLEELTGSKDKSMELSSWELLVQVYGNLNMTEKALDAIKKRDELKQQNEDKK